MCKVLTEIKVSSHFREGEHYLGGTLSIELTPASRFAAAMLAAEPRPLHR
ncbi:hypothetical protein COCNU_02G018660 [Cocos nucifera]|uniref:Uncharacterized protein n=1 Tax=Cocos nucifera TaxID=13894 RepID=A0A8K0I0W8_COCNU|nr:hypothetical protein COCNU_02G018660 [Cocos nucifera]